MKRTDRSGGRRWSTPGLHLAAAGGLCADTSRVFAMGWSYALALNGLAARASTTFGILADGIPSSPSINRV
jgi:hypothetical protein